MSASIISLFITAVFPPNSQQLGSLAQAESVPYAAPMPAWARRVDSRPSGQWALCASCVAVVIVLHLTQISAFLYFKF